jgi:hypothetical protein
MMSNRIIKRAKRSILATLGCSALALAFGGVSARADQGTTTETTQSGSVNQPGGRQKSELTTTSAKVTHIDRDARTVTLRGQDGQEMTVNVPPDLKAYDKLKVGDTVDIDYYQSVAVSLLPPGSKPTMSDEAGRSAGMKGATTGRVITVSAEVIGVDPLANTVTFKGPGGQVKTVNVQDPQIQKKLTDLKPGQMVQFQYEEALATAIRPSSK